MYTGIWLTLTFINKVVVIERNDDDKKSRATEILLDIGGGSDDDRTPGAIEHVNRKRVDVMWIHKKLNIL